MVSGYLSMRRLLVLFSLLPISLIVLLIVHKYFNDLPIELETHWYAVGFISLLPGLINLNLIRDGVAGLLFSGIIANVLLFVSALFSQQININTVYIFVGYLFSVYLVVGFDLMNAKYLDMNAPGDVYSSLEEQIAASKNGEK